MGQSMRRAMIALGLAEPDAPSQAEQRESRAESPRVTESSRDQRVEREERSQVPAPRNAAPQPGRSSAETRPSGSSAVRGSTEGSRESSTPHSARSRSAQPRREAEYRAPVTPIKRAPSTSRENADDMRTITTVHPRSYNDAKSVGESFRDGTPVIMDLTDLGEAEAKRLVDFAAGLVYALHGSIERVTTTVFLLTPSYVEVVDNTTPQETASADEQA
ncbi:MULTISPECIES: cell division protein SepF [Kocuria]|uniref:cell division protein SepF n=1 Tax=Kocuria TaxID=57493 RepID=UPI0006486934|nr:MULTISPECIES: cell division protein SepF [Kocuria]